MELFKQLGISDDLVKAIKWKGFKEPTKIQEQSIPLILKGKDVIGKSETGSGKTFAFSAGLIDNLERGAGVRALVLTPTRELAEQVYSKINDFSKFKPLYTATVYGGVAYGPQEKNMAKADVIVATPGRLFDHIERKTVDLSKIDVLILDEADRMLDMGFIDTVKQIIRRCPKKRQTLLFSATISDDIKGLSRQYMDKPQIISVGDQVDPTKLKQIYFDVEQHQKLSLLITLLRKDHSGLAIVFCNTRRNVEFVFKNLKNNKIKASSIHGGFTQNKRQNALDSFQKEKSQVLVCTDVAARGLDIPGVSHVYNYDICANSKEYIHRIGRTARAGKEGMVMNLLAGNDHDNFSAVMREYRDLNIELVEIPKLEQISVVKNQNNNNRRNGTGYRSNRNSSSRSDSRSNDYNSRPRRERQVLKPDF